MLAALALCSACSHRHAGANHWQRYTARRGESENGSVLTDATVIIVNEATKAERRHHQPEGIYVFSSVLPDLLRQCRAFRFKKTEPNRPHPEFERHSRPGFHAAGRRGVRDGDGDGQRRRAADRDGAKENTITANRSRTSRSSAAVRSNCCASCLAWSLLTARPAERLIRRGPTPTML